MTVYRGEWDGWDECRKREKRDAKRESEMCRGSERNEKGEEYAEHERGMRETAARESEDMKRGESEAGDEGGSHLN